MNDNVVILVEPTTPSNIPVLPRLTLAVANPIKLFATLATNKLVPSAIVVPIPADTWLSEITIPFPAFPWVSWFDEYVTISPVSSPWSLMKIVLVGITIEVAPIPGFSKKIVVPIPTPPVLPNPTTSIGLKYICLLTL